MRRALTIDAMNRTLRQKLGLAPGKRCILVNAPDHAAVTMGLAPDEPAQRLAGRFDHIHLFTGEPAHLAAQLVRLKPHLVEGGALWVSWRKGQRGGLTLKDVIRVAYDAGLVESKTIAFDADWSAIKLTWPKPGKVYRNSYGRLPD